MDIRKWFKRLFRKDEVKPAVPLLTYPSEQERFMEAMFPHRKEGVLNVEDQEGR